MTSSTTSQRSYAIKEAVALTGLPASTLRYYESIGVIAGTGKQRVYSEDDLDTLVWVACLSATGMSVSDMRRYLANSSIGPSAAAEQVALLKAQQERASRLKRIASTSGGDTVQLKIDYWQAVGAGDDAKADALSERARSLAEELKTHRE